MNDIHEDSFIFYRSFYEAMEGMPDKDRLALYEAIVGLALNGELIDLPKSVRGLFILIKPQIEANIRKRMFGRTGGRPPKEKTTGYPQKETNGFEGEKPNYNANPNLNLNAHGECEGLIDKGFGEKEEGEAKTPNVRGVIGTLANNFSNW